MTVIAYRDGILAADSLGVTSGGALRNGRLHKIWRVKGGRVGIVGDVAEALAIVGWLTGGRAGKMPITESKSTGVVIWVPDRGGARVLCLGGDEPVPRARFHAWGGGAQIALGAMYMGASAEEAVRAAIALCTSCGGPVRVLGR